LKISISRPSPFKAQEEGEGEGGGKREEEEGGESEEGSVVDWTDLREAFRREYARPGPQRYKVRVPLKTISMHNNFCFTECLS
jgi:hypothetical protein